MIVVGWLEADVSELSICLIFKGQASWTAWTLKMEQRGSSEKSVLNNPTPRNNPEDEIIIHFDSGRSLR